ncbi:MAG: GNAT family N-acetyltransferase [Flavobacteriales bacterium]|nr:GNAT family N-acetyltransferase [Flavobacteriales bacterium]PIV92371.1 MAG: hypothetical protein COW44_15110 [Flavobacteriaceae bacterium CG17_big_fil_post_rev_8_21_14_2_50_33_15]PJB20242.1 MAG: hypothetical protein CO117_01770 [Flavobacteriaceae bacterium CG_4_9_14_3_um_filter_33_16]
MAPIGIDKRTSFLIDHVLNQVALPCYYSRVINSLSGKSCLKQPNKTIEIPQGGYFSIYDIPSYLKPVLEEDLKNLKHKKTPLYAGYLINLKAYLHFEDYIKTIVRSARWSQLKRYKKRLDLCLKPSYSIYYGHNLNPDEYHKIFESLKQMTARRFAQKEELNFELPYLDFYQEIMHPLILEQKAAIFVIYHEDKPINITLNFFLEDICFHWNSCFDVDYAVFNLGHINMVNHLEWCFNKGFSVFDMGRGDFFHKRKWVDTSYVYEEHYLFSTKSFKSLWHANTMVSFKCLRYQSVQFLKKLQAQKAYGAYVRFKYRWFLKTPFKPLVSIETHHLVDIPDTMACTPINIFEPMYAPLIEPLNYFLHRNQESFHNVLVSCETKQPNRCYFKGLKNCQLMIMHQTNPIN